MKYEVGEHQEIPIEYAFGVSALNLKLGDPIKIESAVFRVISASNSSITVCPYDYVEPVKTKPASKPKYQTPARQFTEFGRNKVRPKQ